MYLMHGRIIFTLIAVVIVTMALAYGQTPMPAPTPNVPPKANVRPTPTPQPSPEPFDKADVKTMAAQCVTFDTEAGTISLELYPESAPETVRNFLNLAATSAYD